MKQSKLVKALKELSAWELRHFSEFIHSPFFNKHSGVTGLVDHLLGFAPDFDAAELTREAVFAHLFPETPFHEQRFKDLLSLTMKLFRQFLGHYELKTNDLPVQMATLGAYQKRQMDRPYQKAHTALMKAVQQTEGKLQSVHLRTLELHESYITYLSGTMSRSVDDSIQKASDRLDVYYLLSKLKYGIEMANRKNVVQQEFKTGMLPEVLRYLDERPEAAQVHPELGLYLGIFRCLTEEDSEPFFQQLLSDIEEHGPELPRLELREIHSYASNFCIRRINTGQRHYLATLLNLYKWALDHKVLLDRDGWLLQWDYKNIV